MKSLIKKILPLVAACTLTASCSNDFLDREPLDKIIPENFYRSEADLAAYTINMYGAFNTHSAYDAGTFISDNNTDNQAAVNASVVFAPGQWRVGSAEEYWQFGTIRNINYFINTVEDRIAKNEIQGSAANINHYLGEAYFFRAYEYYNKLQAVGDFPIIKEVLPDNADILIENSKRRPRNEVARFIIDDLNKAISLLKSGSVENKNRVSKQAALLLKSRVGLFEGTWEKYHRNTAFVPGGPGWPGANKDYLKDFSINLAQEINYFLTQSIEASKEVAESMPLVQSNNETRGQAVFSNPYFKMFADPDMAKYGEIILWRAYKSGLAEHHTQQYLYSGASTGLTKSLVDSYLMKNGLPIYASGSGYKGDVLISNVVADRDERLQMFVQIPGETQSATSEDPKTDLPNILDIPERRSTTGYMLKKGLFGDPFYYQTGNSNINGAIVFRATEAYLNYIEAYYVKNGSLDGTATDYWKKLRKRAGLPEDFNITINATDMNQEQDWAKYSAGQVIDKTLYNIRRERRSELIAEGMRWSDLKRWRAMDQLKNYQVEGFNLWTEMYKQYEAKGIKLKAEPDPNPNVSPKQNSIYLRPYQIKSANNPFYNGFNWTEAHYLAPIGFRAFLYASKDGNAQNSVIYQNPYWPVQAGGTPTK